jgi:hypothetical protein
MQTEAASYHNLTAKTHDTVHELKLITDKSTSRQKYTHF